MAPEFAMTIHDWVTLVMFVGLFLLLVEMNRA